MKILYKSVFLILLPVIVALVSASYSPDFEAYKLIYENDSLLTISDQLNQYTFFNETVFHLINNAFSYFLSDTQTIFTLTFLSILSKFYLIDKISHNNFATYIYVIVFLFYFDGIILRVGLATTFILFSFYLFILRKYIFSLIAILIATQIHITSLVYLFPLFLTLFINSSITTKSIYASPLLLMLNLNFINLISFASTNFNEKYSFYIDGAKSDLEDITINFVGYCFFYFVTIFYTNYKIKDFLLKKNCSNTTFIKTCHIATVFGLLLLTLLKSNAVIAARLSDLLLLPIIFTLSMVINNNFLNKKRFENLMVFAFILTYGIMRNFNVYSVMEFIG